MGWLDGSLQLAGNSAGFGWSKTTSLVSSVVVDMTTCFSSFSKLLQVINIVVVAVFSREACEGEALFEALLASYLPMFH